MAKKEYTSNVPATQSHDRLLELAINKDADIEKLEKLMAMRNQFIAQEASKDFQNALSIFQSNSIVIERKKKVSFTTQKGTTEYNYTPLGDILNAIREPMKEAGLNYRWETEELDTKTRVTCIISHLNGHSERNTMEAVKDASGSKNSIQQLGSTITYLRRYTLTGALGVGTADEDNDGANADKGNGSNEKPKKEFTPEHPKWDDAIKAIKAGSCTIGQIAKKYKLSDENLNKLEKETEDETI